MRNSEELGRDLARFKERFHVLKDEIQKAIVGYDDLLTDTLVAVFARGHVLLEGVPGLGKTFLVQTLSRVLGLTPGRVQCTPDLMPADILGTHIVNENEEGRRVMHFEKGPVFANLILVDEVNRATPKTQAALLEVMQEGAVTAGGETMTLPKPFFVMATQNPMEMEGTYPLPEAQADRFLFKLRVPFPDRATLVEISRRTSAFDLPELSQVMGADELLEFQKVVSEVPVADHVNDYAARLVLATHPATRAKPKACPATSVTGPARAECRPSSAGRGSTAPSTDVPRSRSMMSGGWPCRPCVTGSSSTSRARRNPATSTCFSRR